MQIDCRLVSSAYANSRILWKTTQLEGINLIGSLRKKLKRMKIGRCIILQRLVHIDEWQTGDCKTDKS